MQFVVTILGVSAAHPSYGRHPSGQVVQVQDRTYLVDCGEGTQMRMDEYGIRRAKIDHIFLSHLHGDHYFGLFGLLTSFALNGRQRPLTIHAPDPAIQAILEVVLGPGGDHLGFPLQCVIHPPDQKVLLLEEAWGQVYSLPLQHRIPTTGYLFVERPFPRNMRPEKIQEYQIHFADIPAIKAGEDYVLPNGAIVKNAELTYPPKPPRSFAYCSDTSYSKDLIPMIQGVDLLYHESTFCEDSKERARETGHSTAAEAAAIAQAAQVQQLVLGHYSSRYPDTKVFQTEAFAIFSHTLLGEEGKTYPVGWQP